jgi:hypothetical protein
MRAQHFGKWLLLAGVMLVAAACQSAPTASLVSAQRIVPIAMFVVTPVPTPAPLPTPIWPQASGVRLSANIGPTCAGMAQGNTSCIQPYAGEFVITQLNGAEVTRVVTGQGGQALINLPPGKYILGVRTENIYPLAAPVKVNILPDRYAHISLNLDSGLEWQSQGR